MNERCPTCLRPRDVSSKGCNAYDDPDGTHCLRLGYERLLAERDRLAFELECERCVHRKDNEYLIGERDRLREALRQVEWVEDSDGFRACPMCRAGNWGCGLRVHNPDCMLVAALREDPGQESPPEAPSKDRSRD